VDNLAVWYKADGADLPTLVDLFDEDVKAFNQELAATDFASLAAKSCGVC
jgi:hypothetical protein